MPEVITKEIPEIKIITEAVNSVSNDSSSYGINWEDQKLNPVSRKSYELFSFSRRFHMKFFKNKKYEEQLYGRNIPENEYNVRKYQNLFIYSFIKDNVPKGSRILEIGNGDDTVISHFRYIRECFRLENPEILINELYGPEKVNVQFINYSDVKNQNDSFFEKFDFIFSKSGFDDLDCDENKLDKIFNNINSMLKPGGYALFCFNGKLIREYVICNSFGRRINRTVQFRKGEFSSPSFFMDHNKIINDPDLLDFENTGKTDKDVRIISYNYLWNKKPIQLPESALTVYGNNLKKYPAYIFHHLIKCGGSSLLKVLYNWFNIEVDRLETYGDKESFVKYKINSPILFSDTCITSHFQFEGVFLHQRYPELIAKKDEFRVFFFIRDPLKFRISHYYYSKNEPGFKGFSLKQIISYDKNWISGLLPCDENNYKEVLDRYFFIGIVEKMQTSFDILADLTNKKRMTLPFENVSEKDDQLNEITPEIIEEFKKRNSLDYMVYDYCLEKFNKTLLHLGQSV